MNEQEFKQWLTENGWKISTDRYTAYCKFYAYKEMKGWPDCHCNERPPNVQIHFYELTEPNIYQSCEVGIAAEARSGDWIHFKFYSILLSEIKKKLPGLIKKLGKAWKNVY